MLYKIALIIVSAVLRCFFKIEGRNVENIPQENGVILAANHRSNRDPVMIGITCKRKLRFMAKAELFKKPLFGWLIKHLGAFPISRGTRDVASLKTAFQLLKNGEAMVIFPEGSRIRKGKQQVKAKPGAVLLACHAEVPIVPVCISGKYRWTNKITVTYGEPITFEEYYGKKMDAEKMQILADEVLDKVRGLAIDD